MTAAATPPRPRDKWRPSLGAVVAVVLTTVAALPLSSLFFFRIYENELIHQTESELVTQAAAVAATWSRELGAVLPVDAPLGPLVPPPAEEAPYSRVDVPARLDLAADAILPPRPDARPPAAPADPAVLALGARLGADLAAIRRTTLAGFRVLDAAGTVMAGREEIGLSLAHVEEVAEALRGTPSSRLRLRVSKHEPPPLYSLSRGTGVRVFVAVPIVARDRVAGVVYVSRTPSNVIKRLYEERWRVAAAGGAILLLTLAIGFVFHRAITRPVRELIARTARIERGDRTALRPLDHHGTAELAELSRGLLDLAGHLTRRSDFVATFARHVSHEMKSPLTSIQGAVELLRDDLADGAMSEADRRAFLDNVLADTRRLTAIVARLRDLARAETSPTGGVTTVDAALMAVAVDLPDVKVAGHGDTSAEVRMSSETLAIVLAHLGDNAARHGATRLDVTVRRRPDRVEIAVADDGHGISPGNRDKVFDAFFTTRRESGGTGMGLVIVRAMLEAHGGEIALAESTAGALFELVLPAADGPRA